MGKYVQQFHIFLVFNRKINYYILNAFSKNFKIKIIWKSEQLHSEFFLINFVYFYK